jgi:hypothetical protein
MFGAMPGAMKKSFALLTLAAMVMALGGCGGSEEPAPAKKTETKKKGGKQKPHENPWAVETQGADGDAAKAAAKPEKKKKKGKESETANPWAKENPSPAAEE